MKIDMFWIWLLLITAGFLFKDFCTYTVYDYAVVYAITPVDGQTITRQGYYTVKPSAINRKEMAIYLYKELLADGRYGKQEDFNVAIIKIDKLDSNRFSKIPWRRVPREV